MLQLNDIPSWLLAAFDNVSDHIYIKDRERRFVFANKALALASKLQPSQLIGRRDEDLFSDEHLLKAKADDQAIIDNGHAASILAKPELETWRDGRLTWVLTTKVPIFDQANATLGLFGISRELNCEDPNCVMDHLSRGESLPASGVAGVYYQNTSLAAGAKPKAHEVVWSNAHFAQMFPGNTTLSRFRRIHKIDRTAVFEFLHNAINARAPFSWTLDFRAKGANDDYVWIRGHAVAFEHMARRHFLVTHENISEAKVRETLSWRIADSFPGFLFVKDSSGSFKFMNRSLLEFLRMELKEVLGKTDRQLGFPDEQIAAFARGDEAVLSGSEDPYISKEELITSPTKEQRALVTIKMAVPATAFSPHEADKKARHVLGISMDITSPWRKMYDAMQLWTSLLQNSPDAVFCKGKDGKYAQVNSTFAELVGLNVDRVVDKTAAEVWAHCPELLKEIVQEDQEVITSGRAIKDRTKTIRKPNGEVRIGLTSKIPVLDDQGRIRRILGISRDVTELHRALAFSKYLPDQLWNRVGDPPPPAYKWITVLFCDIRGFSCLASKLKDFPKVLFDFLVRYSTMIVSTVAEHRCMLDKLMGDGAMVLSGALESDDDEGARSACQAVGLAIGLRDRFPGVYREWHYDNRRFLMRHDYGLQLAIGVHVGQAIVGYFSAGQRDQFTAFGDVVNLAQRLEASAATNGRGSILISQPVAARVEGKFVLESLGDITPPKETEAIAAFSVLQSKDPS